MAKKRRVVKKKDDDVFIESMFFILGMILSVTLGVGAFQTGSQTLAIVWLFMSFVTAFIFSYNKLWHRQEDVGFAFLTILLIVFIAVLIYGLFVLVVIPFSDLFVKLFPNP